MTIRPWAAVVGIADAGIGRSVADLDHAAARDPEDGLWRAGRRALTVGLVLTITLVALRGARHLDGHAHRRATSWAGIELYGWVFSAFFLGSLIGIVVVGGAIDRGGLAVPFAVGLGLFAIGLLVGGLAPSMLVLVAARFVQGLGAGAIQPIAYVAIGRTPARDAAAADVRDAVDGVGPARRHRPGDRRGPSARRSAGGIVFLGLLPLIAARRAR